MVRHDATNLHTPQGSLSSAPFTKKETGSEGAELPGAHSWALQSPGRPGFLWLHFTEWLPTDSHPCCTSRMEPGPAARLCLGHYVTRLPSPVSLSHQEEQGMDDRKR